MKVFISQPFHGKSEREIFAERERICKENDLNRPDCEIIDQYHQPEDNRKFAYLSKGILMMGEADLIIFAKGWETASGCVVEHTLAVLYGLSYIEEL